MKQVSSDALSRAGNRTIPGDRRVGTGRAAKGCKENLLKRLAHVVNDRDLADKRSEIQIHKEKQVY